MLADALRAFYNAHIGIINSDGIRCDRIMDSTPGNPLIVKDVLDTTPYGNIILIKRVQGSVLLQALENAFSDAHLDGRFLQISGLELVVSRARPEGSRVLEAFHVPSGDKYRAEDPSHSQRRSVQRDEWYTIAMPDFVANGGVGFGMFMSQETLFYEGITDATLLLGIFENEEMDPPPLITNKTTTDIPASVTGAGASGEGALAAVKMADGLRRARAAIIVGREVDGLPIVNPEIQGRIKYVD